MQLLRCNELINKFEKKFGKQSYKMFGSPGRVEIGGNHIDHNHGEVIVASINLDSILAVSRNNNGKVLLCSDQYSEPFNVNLVNTEPVKSKKATTIALIRGIAAGFKITVIIKEDLMPVYRVKF